MFPDEIDVPHAIVRVLEEAGIRFVFGMPGGDTGRIFDAQEAMRLGLVNAVVAPEKLLDAARELATSLLANSPTSLQRTKALLSQCSKEQLDREIEWAVQENAAIRVTEDFREGVTSFLDKRKPDWKGR